MSADDKDLPIGSSGPESTGDAEALGHEREQYPDPESYPDALPDPQLAPDPDLPNADLQVDDPTGDGNGSEPTRGGHD